MGRRRCIERGRIGGSVETNNPRACARRPADADAIRNAVRHDPRKGFENLFELAASAVLRWAEVEGIALKAKLQQKLAHVAITYVDFVSCQLVDRVETYPA